MKLVVSMPGRRTLSKREEIGGGERRNFQLPSKLLSRVAKVNSQPVNFSRERGAREESRDGLIETRANEDGLNLPLPAGDAAAKRGC